MLPIVFPYASYFFRRNQQTNTSAEQYKITFIVGNKHTNILHSFIKPEVIYREEHPYLLFVDTRDNVAKAIKAQTNIEVIIQTLTNEQ